MLKEQMNDIEYMYDAFISYRHVSPDKEIAQSLHRALESYRVPSRLAKKGVPVKTRKIFRDSEELPSSSDLSRDIEEALRKSRFLIVVCSPETPKSSWVAREIQMFKEFHGDNNVLAVLVTGEPQDSFPIQLVKRIKVEPGQIEDIEPLAADIRAEYLKKSLKLLQSEKLRLLARLLNCQYDDLKQREFERTIKRILAIASSAVVFFVALGIFIFLQLRIVTSERNEAQRARELANENERKAIAQEKIALEQKKLAEEERNIAQQARELANKNELRAVEQEKIAIEQKGLAEEERNKAVLSARIADEQRSLAQQRQQEAIFQKNVADNERNNSMKLQFKALATLSRSQTESGNRLQGIASALQAFPGDLFKQDYPYVKEAEDSLFNASFTYPFNTSLTYQWDKVILGYGYLLDDQRFYIYSEDEVGIYDRYTGNRIKSYKTNSNSIKILAVSPKGDRVVLESANEGGSTTASLWDIDKNEKVWDLRSTSNYTFYNSYYSNFNGLFRAAFNYDGSRLCTWEPSGNEQDNLQVWDTFNGSPIYSLDGTFDDVRFTGLGGLQITRPDMFNRYDENGSLDVSLSVNYFQCLDDYKNEAASARRIEVDGKYAWEVCIYNIKTTNELYKFIINESWPKLKVLRYDSTGGKLYVSATGKNSTSIDSILIINLLTGKVSQINGVNDVSDLQDGVFSSDRKNIAVRENDATVKILDLEYSKDSVFMPVDHIEFSKYGNDGNGIYLAKSNGAVEQRDTSTGELLNTYIGHEDFVQSISEDVRGSRIATASYNDRSVRVWNINTGELLHKITCPESENFFSVAFSPDGKYLATYGNEIKLWDAETYELIRTVDRGKSTFKFTDLQNRAMSFDQSGKKLLAISFDEPISSSVQVVYLWDLEEGRTLFKISADNPQSGFDNVIFVSEDKYIMTTANSHIAFWNALDGGKVKDLYFSEFIRDVVDISPDGKKAAVCGFEDTYIIDLQTFAIEKIIKGQSSVYSVSFSPDSRRLIIAYDDAVHVWAIDSGVLLLKQNVTHNEDPLSHAIAWFNPRGETMSIITKAGVVIQPYFSYIWELIKYAETQLEP